MEGRQRRSFTDDYKRQAINLDLKSPEGFIVRGAAHASKKKNKIARSRITQRRSSAIQKTPLR
jgi:hypothetical protein